MVSENCPFAWVMGCFGCFGLSGNPRRNQSQEFLLDEEIQDGVSSYNGEVTNNALGDKGELQSRLKQLEEILKFKVKNRLVCRQFPVKDTHRLFYSEDENGNKMVNNYVRERKIASGMFGKVALYQSTTDGKHYAIKAFNKSHLSKVRVAPSENAMSDVRREALIMKSLEHPNIVNLFEVIDDPNTNHFYMVLEYVEGKLVCEGFGDTRGISEDTVRKYLRDIVSGLIYLHAHNIVHGDIKPDNLLITSAGTVKIGDFNVSQLVEDCDDELRRAPGTPVFTAPECCSGSTYHGKAADTWAVGVTLYCMIFGKYPFLGETIPDTYDRIVSKPLILPDDMNPELRNLLEGLLCKDPRQRMTLNDIAEHTWVIGEYGSIPQYSCWCKRNALQGEETSGSCHT